MSPERVIQIWHETRNHEKFKARIKQEGFKYLGCGRASTVFTRPDVDFVVKVGRGIHSHKFANPDLEKHRLPYLYVNGNSNFGIQKKVRRDKKSKYRAFKKLQEVVPAEIPLYDFDIHQDNVGWLNRKPVIFDYK